MKRDDGEGRENCNFGDGSLVEIGKGGLGDFRDNTMKEALFFWRNSLFGFRWGFSGGGRRGGR